MTGAQPFPLLLVEDDENDVFFFQRALEKTGFRGALHVARDGREAIECLSGSSAFQDGAVFSPPSVVVLDLNLPVKNGLEVLQWIRKQKELATLPVIVLTSSTADLDVCDAYRLGANSYLVKPSDPEKLVELVSLLKKYWLEHNRVPPPPSPASVNTGT